MSDGVGLPGRETTGMSILVDIIVYTPTVAIKSVS